MRKNLTRHGNSLALVIDKPILELIGADANTTFEITTDGRNLTLNPIREADRNEALREALRLTNEQFGYDLKKLAE